VININNNSRGQKMTERPKIVIKHSTELAAPIKIAIMRSIRVNVGYGVGVKYLRNRDVSMTHGPVWTTEGLDPENLKSFAVTMRLLGILKSEGE
jgi:hypothetical protein